MIFSVGLTIIVVGWSFQTYRTLVKRDQRLNPIFLILYGAGSAVLAYGSFLNADMTAGILNTACLILATNIATAMVRQKST